jgi:hypothetical protein
MRIAQISASNGECGIKDVEASTKRKLIVDEIEQPAPASFASTRIGMCVSAAGRGIFGSSAPPSDNTAKYSCWRSAHLSQQQDT